MPFVHHNYYFYKFIPKRIRDNGHGKICVINTENVPSTQQWRCSVETTRMKNLVKDHGDTDMMDFFDAAVAFLNSMVDRRSSIVDGRWSMVDRRWSMVDGRWSMVDGRWSIVDGRSSIVSCRMSHRQNNLVQVPVTEESVGCSYRRGRSFIRKSH